MSGRVGCLASCRRLRLVHIDGSTVPMPPLCWPGAANETVRQRLKDCLKDVLVTTPKGPRRSCEPRADIHDISPFRGQEPARSGLLVLGFPYKPITRETAGLDGGLRL